MPSLPANAPAADRRRWRPGATAAAALVVGAVAFALYQSTLLPGLDFGDTASFQTMVGSDLLTPRDGYPLYFAIANLFQRIVPGEPAHALNVASAVEGAVAVGLIVFVGAELAGSIIAGAAGALLFAVSYTFWSQAIIAEVYALHAVFICLTLLALLRWERHPTIARLALFFALYALGFGNHLSMVLLLPAYTVFLLAAAPAGWRSMFSPRIVALAVALAVAGALQYLPELRALWLMPQAPHSVLEGLQHFWFDVTKTDWRDTMVMNVPRAMFSDHVAMYWFDLRQQVGVAVPVLAALGVVQLWLSDARRAVLILLLYAVNVVFAFSYNVGDTHVFYIPSHLIVALLAACGVALAGRLFRFGAPIAGALLIAYAAARGYHDFPALDRSGDTRPSQVLSALTEGIDDRRAILVADLNWQIQNGLSYFTKVTRPEVAAARMPDVLLHAPQLVADNAAIHREVIVTERARTELDAAYGPLLPTTPDHRIHITTLPDIVRELPAGTRYVLTILKPSRDLALDAAVVADALRAATGDRLSALPESDYAAVAGFTGSAPVYIAASAAPFRREVEIGAVPTEVRMESWLAADTIRRMGFGQVVAARQHTLIVERGISFVAFDERGRPVRTAYAFNIFSPQRRYLVH